MALIVHSSISPTTFLLHTFATVHYRRRGSTHRLEDCGFKDHNWVMLKTLKNRTPPSLWMGQMWSKFPLLWCVITNRNLKTQFKEHCPFGVFNIFLWNLQES